VNVFISLGGERFSREALRLFFLTGFSRAMRIIFISVSLWTRDLSRARVCVCVERAASDDLWLEIDLRGAKAKCLSKADALFIVCHAGLALAVCLFLRFPPRSMLCVELEHSS
jgi:hypothetical protein